MFKKESFAVLLLVSLVSTILFAGMVKSLVGPSISVYPSTGITASSDVYVYVTGSGWNSGAPVTLYWDQQSDNHTIAIMAPSTSGTFRLNQLEIERVPIGVHKIIAVQGVNTATCTYTVTATMPPDETLLDQIQQVENNLANTQSNFTTVISGLGDIENKLDNTTSGLPGIQYNLSLITTLLKGVTSLSQGGGGIQPLENRTYDLYAGAESDFVVEALYVYIVPSFGATPTSSPNIVFNNVSFASNFFTPTNNIYTLIYSTPYTCGNGTLELWHTLNIEPPAGLVGGAIDVCVTASNVPSSTWDLFFGVIIESTASSGAFSGGSMR